MIEVAVKKSFKNNKIFQYNLKTNNEKVVLFGPSGSGKSNLIKMIVGLIDPDEGKIKINNNIFFESKFKKLPIYKRRVGYLPQEYTLFPHMTVEENILYGTKINKIKFDREKYNELLEKLELVDKLYLYPDSLSGGEKQRVALLRALMINPDILLFDEPFSSLDKVIKEKLRDTVVDIIDETEKKAIFVTHDLEDAYILGEEVFIVYNGKIIENGTADEVFNRPKFVETAKIINIKNIWKREIFESVFSLSNINSEFLAIKHENIILNPENYHYNFEAEIEKIKTKGMFIELQLKFKNLTLYSLQPKFKLNADNIKEGKKIKIGFNENSFIKLKSLKS